MTALLGHDEQRRGRATHRREERREVVDAAARRKRRTEIDDHEAETFAAQRGGSREEHLVGVRGTHDDQAVEIDARAKSGKRVERCGGIDPRRHAAFALGCGRHGERECLLSRRRGTDECQWLTGADAATGHAVERAARLDTPLALLTLGHIAARHHARPVAGLDARDRVGQCGGSHSAPLVPPLLCVRGD